MLSQHSYAVPTYCGAVSQVDQALRGLRGWQVTDAQLVNRSQDRILDTCTSDPSRLLPEQRYYHRSPHAQDVTNSLTPVTSQGGHSSNPGAWAGLHLAPAQRRGAACGAGLARTQRCRTCRSR